ncbi:MAG: ROK family protein [Balneolaceae bacterium]
MNQSKTVLTLDAGGTNFVFSAIENEKELVDPVTLPAQAHDLKLCLANLIAGFESIISQLDKKPDAISFAFPGPADYPKGIIGNLPNFKAFKGGVALGPMLEDEFGIPVFINNDGNLFAYGEALNGILPEINQKLEAAGSVKRFNNLIGITIGTGFGCGIVLDGKLLTGDNSCGSEIHNTLNVGNSDWNAEESVSTRAIQRVYAEEAGLDFEALMPGEIYEIAKDEKDGNIVAALTSFQQFGTALGNSIANVLTLIDGLVVIGGGVSAGWDLFAPFMFKALRKKYNNFNGDESDRLSFVVYDLEDEQESEKFLKGNSIEIIVPRSGRKIEYDNWARAGVGKTVLGTSNAVNLGAYAYALNKLNEEKLIPPARTNNANKKMGNILNEAAG